MRTERSATSNPICATDVIRLVQAGAPWEKGCLLRSGVREALVITPAHAWATNLRGNHQISRETYDLLRAGKPQRDGSFTVGDVRYVLDSRNRDGVSVATHVEVMVGTGPSDPTPPDPEPVTPDPPEPPDPESPIAPLATATTTVTDE